jgi:hypothetical protein
VGRCGLNSAGMAGTSGRFSNGLDVYGTYVPIIYLTQGTNSCKIKV